MAGKLLRLSACLGDAVKAGQTLAVIEAMKMENELVAPLDGVVVELGQTAPSAVDKGALIARIEPV
jgi:biotin carboxyl carrier protein